METLPPNYLKPIYITGKNIVIRKDPKVLPVKVEVVGSSSFAAGAETFTTSTASVNYSAEAQTLAAGAGTESYSSGAETTGAEFGAEAAGAEFAGAATGAKFGAEFEEQV